MGPSGILEGGGIAPAPADDFPSPPSAHGALVEGVCADGVAVDESPLNLGFPHGAIVDSCTGTRGVAGADGMKGPLGWLVV